MDMEQNINTIWVFFNDGSWSQPSTDGNVYNLGIYGNAGYMLNENIIFSLWKE